MIIIFAIAWQWDIFIYIYMYYNTSCIPAHFDVRNVTDNKHEVVLHKYSHVLYCVAVFTMVARQSFISAMFSATS